MSWTGLLLLGTIAAEALGIVTSVALYADARKDREAVNQLPEHDVRRVVARVSVHTEALRTVTYVLFLLTTLGIATAVVSYEMPSGGWLMFARLTTLLAIIGLLAQSVLVYRMRRKLFDLYRFHDTPHV